MYFAKSVIQKQKKDHMTTATGDDLLIINLKVYAFKVSLTMYVLQQVRMVVMRLLTPTINSQLACDGNLNNTQKCKKFNCGDGVVKQSHLNATY